MWDVGRRPGRVGLVQFYSNGKFFWCASARSMHRHVEWRCGSTAVSATRTTRRVPRLGHRPAALVDAGRRGAARTRERRLAQRPRDGRMDGAAGRVALLLPRRDGGDPACWPPPVAAAVGYRAWLLCRDEVRKYSIMWPWCLLRRRIVLGLIFGYDRLALRLEGFFSRFAGADSMRAGATATSGRPCCGRFLAATRSSGWAWEATPKSYPIYFEAPGRVPGRVLPHAENGYLRWPWKPARPGACCSWAAWRGAGLVRRRPGSRGATVGLPRPCSPDGRESRQWHRRALVLPGGRRGQAAGASLAHASVDFALVSCPAARWS